MTDVQEQLASKGGRTMRCYSKQEISKEQLFPTVFHDYDLMARIY